MFESQYISCEGPCKRLIAMPHPLADAFSVGATYMRIDGQIYCLDCGKKEIDKRGIAPWPELDARTIGKK